MAPIRRGDGTGLNAKGFAKVRKGDGTVLWSASDTPDNGVSRWEFEQSADDSWGDNDGSVTGASYVSDSKRGDYALDFDGSDDEFVVSHDSSISFEGDFTVSIWVNFDGISDSYPRFMTKGEGSGGNYDLFYHDGYERYEFRVGNDNSRSNISKSNETWTHLVGKVEEGTAYIYIDKNEEASKSVDPPTNTEDLFIGSSSGGNYFDGQIDDPRIYDEALSDSRITDIYNGDE